jgi:hypothetical protein
MRSARVRDVNFQLLYHCYYREPRSGDGASAACSLDGTAGRKLTLGRIGQLSR